MSRKLDKTNGLSFAEIAERLNITISAVRHDYDQALMKMKTVNPELGAAMLEKINTLERRYARLISKKTERN